MQQEQLRAESFTLCSFAFQEQGQQESAYKAAAYRATAYSPTTQLRFCFRGSFREESFNTTFAAYSLDLDKLELSFQSLAQINKPESLQKKIGKEQVHSFFVNNSFNISLPNLSSKNNKELDNNIFQKNIFNKSFFNISFPNNK